MSTPPKPLPKPAHAAVWAIVETITGAVFSTITYLVMTWFMPTAEFGIGMLALALGQILSSATEIVFADYVIATPGLEVRRLRELNAANLLFAVAVAVALGLSAPAIEAAMQTPRLGDALLALTSIILCSGIGAIPLACLKRDMAFNMLARRTLVVRVLSCVFGLALAWYGFGLWAIVGQQIALSLVNMLILLLIRRVGYARPGQTGVLRHALKFTAGNFFPSMMAGNVNRLLVFAVGAIAGPRDVAFVSMAARVVDAITFPILGGLGQVTLPILSRAKAMGYVIEDTYKKAASLTSAVAMPVFVGLAVTAPWFTATLLAPHWAPAAIFISLLALERGIRVMFAVNGPLLTILGRPASNFRISLIDVTIGLILLTSLGQSGAVAGMIGWSLKALVYLPVSANLTARISGIAVLKQVTASRTALMATLVMVVFSLAGGHALTFFPGHRGAAVVLLAEVAAGIFGYGLALRLFDWQLVQFLIGQFRPGHETLPADAGKN